MNEFLRRAKELEHQMQKDRRYLHQHAEAGKHLPGTTKYVMERLSSIGLSPREICDSGITALIEGSCPGKTILLRADMDAFRQATSGMIDDYCAQYPGVKELLDTIDSVE